MRLDAAQRLHFSDEQRVDAAGLRGAAIELGIVVERGEHPLEELPQTALDVLQ